MGLGRFWETTPRAPLRKTFTLKNLWLVNQCFSPYGRVYRKLKLTGVFNFNFSLLIKVLCNSALGQYSINNLNTLLKYRNAWQSVRWFKWNTWICYWFFFFFYWIQLLVCVSDKEVFNDQICSIPLVYVQSCFGKAPV